MMIVRRTHILLVLALLCSNALYGATASDLVRKAQAADSQVSYRGTKVARVVAAGRAVSSLMKIVHLKPDMTRTEYSSPKMLAGVVVVQCGSSVWKHARRQRSWERLHSASSAAPDGDIDVALSNYNVRLVGDNTTIGRKTYVVLATPKRAGESVLRLWIDKQNYLILRSQVEKPGVGVTSSSSFNSISINPPDISRSAFVVPAREKSAPKVGKLDFSVAKPRYLPKGYKLVGQTRNRVNAHLVVHLQFSNGVNTISLFERRSRGDAKAPKVPDRFSSVMTWTRHEVLFTLIGDLPRAELQKIADSTI